MEAEQGIQDDTPYYEEKVYEDSASQDLDNEQQIEQEEYAVQEEVVMEQDQRQENENFRLHAQEEDRSSFLHGLSVGLGIGCIATFVIMWITVFFTPMLPSTVTYESMLSIFIYPLIYLLTVGLIALTAGIVREYYARKNNL